MMLSLQWWLAEAACHLSQWAGGRVGGTAAVIQRQDKHEVAPSNRVL